MNKIFLIIFNIGIFMLFLLPFKDLSLNESFVISIILGMIYSKIITRSDELEEKINELKGKIDELNKLIKK